MVVTRTAWFFCFASNLLVDGLVLWSVRVVAKRVLLPPQSQQHVLVPCHRRREDIPVLELGPNTTIAVDVVVVALDVVVAKR